MFATATAAVVTTALLAPAAAQAAGKPWSVTAMSGSTPIAKAYGDFAKNGPYATVGSLSDRLSPDGKRARAEIKVCEDRSHAYDKCSGNAVVIFDY
ncbi:hypothetical protein [Fodinicola acaciae]|uniref:hypothetical protein n=1 Tax=Fodinicola acaciae TaxID=2681555 RepID=UPI0013D6DD21|nr:hypothetical protein [Fodinicola acaciae]